MENKVSQVREHVLGQLESGKLKAGDKLPGAREVARQVKVSFAKAQQTLDLLVKDGILESFPRKGTFVQRGWAERILQQNISLFAPEACLPWVAEFRRQLAARLPDLRVATGFPKAVFEIRTTLQVQAERDAYLDLREVFDACYPDKTAFFTHPFKTFYMDGRLPGLPLIFSPRVMFFNPELLANAGCDLPRAGWTWDDFLECARRVRANAPTAGIINWSTESFVFMNVIFRAGGCLIVPDADDPVRIDHPATRRGVRLFRELRDAVGLGPGGACVEFPQPSFLEGKMAFNLASREDLLPRLEAAGMDNWGTAPLPLIEGGVDITAQATDLLCVRKSCVDMAAVAEMVKLLLSEEFQDYLGKVKYGIPIRKSSAMKSIDLEDPRDTLFLTESAKITAEYNVDSPELAGLVVEGIRQILESDVDIDASTSRLADAVRTFLSVRRNKARSARK